MTAINFNLTPDFMNKDESNNKLIVYHKFKLPTTAGLIGDRSL